MKVLKGVLDESRAYYLDLKEKVEKRLTELPKGSVKLRRIAGQDYWYLQRREKERVIHDYIGKDRPEKLIHDIDERRKLQSELKVIYEALRMLKRVERSRRV